jgi:ribosomal protein S18 acetylase RimI-like enzyme
MNGEIVCTDISFEEVRRLPPIVSSFETDRVFRLEERRTRGVPSWQLEEEHLDRPFRKRYDSGRTDDWLEPYLEVAPLETLHFIAATRDGTVRGLLTWQQVKWNNTTWLMDIRARREDRRSGVGSAMIDRLRTETVRLKTRGISVETQINNYPAIRFYRRNRFLISGFNTRLYTNGDMEKQDIALFLFWEAR